MSRTWNSPRLRLAEPSASNWPNKAAGSMSENENENAYSNEPYEYDEPKHVDTDSSKPSTNAANSSNDSSPSPSTSCMPNAHCTTLSGGTVGDSAMMAVISSARFRPPEPSASYWMK